MSVPAGCVACSKEILGKFARAAGGAMLSAVEAGLVEGRPGSTAAKIRGDMAPGKLPRGCVPVSGSLAGVAAAAAVAAAVAAASCDATA